MTSRSKHVRVNVKGVKRYHREIAKLKGLGYSDSEAKRLRQRIVESGGKVSDFNQTKSNLPIFDDQPVSVPRGSDEPVLEQVTAVDLHIEVPTRLLDQVTKYLLGVGVTDIHVKKLF